MIASRRDIIKGAGTFAAFAAAQGSIPAASAVDAGCTGQITPNPRTVMPRMPLEEFVQTPRLVDALRHGVNEMKKRKPSDPRSWFFQAAIHGVQLDATDPGYKYYQAALAADPDVAKVDRKFWNQCPHFKQNSANFVPWHRAYTFHFEQILREHTGDGNFSLPYWNYGLKANRKFPKIFGIQHLDGDPGNNADNNINPLFMAERDFFLTYYEHPLIPNMPILELTDAVVDASPAMNSDVFFGETETTGLGGGIADQDANTRGLLESHPHDNIHRVVGGIIQNGGPNCNGAPTDGVGAMAQPPTAAFDPIFPVHHTNIDRLWAEWSCTSGKKWGELPSKEWFQDRPWFFFDAQGNCVNEPRYKYFDYRKLGIKFKYDKLDRTPLALPDFGSMPAAQVQFQEVQFKAPERVTATDATLSIGTAQRTVLALPAGTRSDLAAPMAALRAQSSGAPTQKRLLLRITVADPGRMPTVGFDVHVTTNSNAALTRSSSSFVGSVHLFLHAHANMPSTQDFDITKAVGSVDTANLRSLNVVFVPVALTQAVGSGAPNLQSEPLRLTGFEFLVVDR